MCYMKGELFSTPLDKDGITQWSWHTCISGNDHPFLDISITLVTWYQDILSLSNGNAKTKRRWILLCILDTQHLHLNQFHSNRFPLQFEIDFLKLLIDLSNNVSGDTLQEHRRVCHINAEQKRRCNIKNGFDMLQSLLPGGASTGVGTSSSGASGSDGRSGDNPSPACVPPVCFMLLMNERSGRCRCEIYRNNRFQLIRLTVSNETMEIDNSYENESDANHRKTNEFS